jgi:NAD(P)H-hydrate epimerase
MFLTREQARALDRRAIDELGIPGIVLMENAGRGMAELLLALGVQGRVVVCCGKGNNGGDGLVIARFLANHGVQTQVLLFAEPEKLPADAEVNCGVIQRMSAHDAATHPFEGGVTLQVVPGEPDNAWLAKVLQGAEWVVDALFGSGLRGAVPAPFDRIITAVNATPAKIFAVDIPSGLDSDTGLATGPTIRAHHTATVAAPKKGFAELTAAQWLGQVHVVDMGIPQWLLQTSGTETAR